jgi:hypothetical protein
MLVNLMSNVNLNQNHPYFQTITATTQSLSIISNNIRTNKNSKRDFVYLIISVFLGVVTSLLVSFEYTKIMSIYFFVISFSILLGIYIIHRKKSNSEIKKLISEQEDCILRLYDFRQITKKQLEDYSKRGLLSYKKVLQLLEDSKKKLEEQIRPELKKIKIIYEDNSEEAIDFALVEQFRINCFDKNLIPTKIIFINPKIFKIEFID